MPKTRQIKPEFWDDAEIGRMPHGARLLFICTWNLADDFGNLRSDSRYLMARAFAFDEGVTTRHVGQWVRVLTTSGHLKPYKAGGEGYLHVASFNKHQSTRKAMIYRQVAPSPFDVIPVGYTPQDELKMIWKRTQKNMDTRATGKGNGTGYWKGEGSGEGPATRLDYYSQMWARGDRDMVRKALAGDSKSDREILETLEASDEIG